MSQQNNASPKDSNSLVITLDHIEPEWYIVWEVLSKVGIKLGMKI